MDRPAAIIFRQFGPYHCARLKAAASLFPISGVEVVPKDKNRPWKTIEDRTGFLWKRVLPELSQARHSIKNLGRKIYATLNEIEPSVVAIPGWSAPEALHALSWCLKKNTPAVLMADSTALDKPRSPVAERIKARLLRLYTSAFVGGQRQRQYLLQLGFREASVFQGYDVVDNDHFAHPRGADERIGGLSGFFLVSARLIPVKNLTRLLIAYAKYRSTAGHSALSLVIAGEGPERDNLLATMRSFHLDGSVRLLGFVHYEELPTLYGSATALILPSTSETWGLVVNEAMAAGLPVLVSNRCGCAPDLVEEGGNGFTFDPYDTDGLAELMLTVSTMPEQQRQAMGRRSREIIQNWGLERFAQGLKSAVEVALSSQTPKASVFDRLLLRVLAYRKIHD